MRVRASYRILGTSSDMENEDLQLLAAGEGLGFRGRREGVAKHNPAFFKNAYNMKHELIFICCLDSFLSIYAKILS